MKTKIKYKTDPFVSIIIPVYNESRTLEACLKSLLRLDYLDYEVIMVDDASSDNSLEIIKKYANYHDKIRFISNLKNLGIAGSRNAGIKSAKGEIFIFSDGDCTFFPYWPKNMVKTLSDPSVGACGGRDKSPPNEPLIKKCIDYTMTSFIGTGGIRGSNLRLGRFAFTGCNFAIKKEVVEKIGLQNEKFREIGRGEEKEWSQRVWDAGYKVKFVDNSFVLHYRRSTLKEFFIQTYKSGKARYQILKTRPNAFEIIHIIPSIYLVTIMIVGVISFISKIFSLLLLIIIFPYIFALFIQTCLGIIKIKNIFALILIPITTIIMHFAYGFGFIKKFIYD